MDVGLDGRTLNHYEIRERIGVGGMGEVYRAVDKRLGRDVAIKRILQQFDEQSDSFARFRREAKLLASLNHPGIAAIHGFEEAEGIHFLVLEFVPGDDLAARLIKGRLPIEAALPLARQIAEALQALHARGVIHRDLKPANIKLTSEGQAKVLDFGLAKAFEPPEGEQQEQTTVTSGDPQTRGILGTGPYMSPEQARGRELDKRTDIWSFGCVLFEMLTGQRVFRGATLSDTVARVLDGEPDWSALPDETPASIRRLLRRCLEKDAAHRLQDIGDACIEIDDALAGPREHPAVEAVLVPRALARRPILPIAVGAILVLAAFLTGLFLSGRPGVTAGVTRFTVGNPSAYWLPTHSETPNLALSPDGETLIYSTLVDERPSLRMRRMDGLESASLSEGDGARGAFFSPDGQWLGLFRGLSMWKAPLAGGTAIEIAPMALPRGASWAPDGSIIYSPLPEAGLYRIASEAGARPTVLTEPDRAAGQRSHRWPHVIPDGKSVLYTVAFSNIETFDQARIDVLSLETGESRPLVPHGTYPLYAATGHLLYVYRGTVMAVPFDPKAGETTGLAVPVVERVLTQPNSGGAHIAVSSSGTLVYLEGKSRAPERSIVWLHPSGSRLAVKEKKSYNGVRISPDGERFVVDVDGACAQIWVHDRDGGSEKITHEWSNTSPIWTQDGRSITFASDRASAGNLYSIDAGGGGAAERLTTGAHKQWPGSWSPDGEHLVYVEEHPVTGEDLWLLPRNGKPRPLLVTPQNESDPQFSPDGNWLAYVSDESDRSKVYVRAHPDDGQRWAVSNEYSVHPRWSKDGATLFFLQRGHIASVDVRDGPPFDRPHEIVKTGAIDRRFDVGPDGSFLVVKLEAHSEERPIHVVVNWFEELKRLTRSP